MSTTLRALLEPFPLRARTGSKPRCHLLTAGHDEDVVRRLDSILAPFATVAPDDSWMPCGFNSAEEAQLHVAHRLIDAPLRKELRDWWLAIPQPRAATPNFDIASTCRVARSPGLALFEAKAHWSEIEGESGGKRHSKGPSANSLANHAQISDAIQQAARGLTSDTGMTWGISSESHYQLSNRFAWSWRLARAGYHVVLVYLGFLRASEMGLGGRRTFSTHGDWTAAVLNHGRGIVPESAWNRTWPVATGSLTAIIRSGHCKLSWPPEWSPSSGH